MGEIKFAKIILIISLFLFVIMTKVTLPPPSIDYAPLDLQKELINMQKMSSEELLTIANSKVSENQEKLHLQLLEKNQNNQLNQPDILLLETLRINADRLMFKKAYAYAVLKCKGYEIPDFNQLREE